MLDKLRHPVTRRIFIAFCLFGALGAAMANYGLNRTVIQDYQQLCAQSRGPEQSQRTQNDIPLSPKCTGWRAFVAEVAPGVTVEFLSAFLIAASFVALLALLRADEESVDDVHQLFRPTQRSSHLEALGRTDFWIHDGHIASWVRRYVLPKFVDDARRTLSSRKIQVAVLDPCCSTTCENFLAHIKSLEVDEQRLKSLDDFRVEICCLIVEFANNLGSTHLELELYLKTEMDLLRRDITSVRAFITTPGKDKPAIGLENRSTSVFYHIYLLNFRDAVKRYKKVDLASVAKAGMPDGASSNSVRLKAKLAAAFSGSAPDFCTDTFCTRLLEKCNLPT